MARLDQAYALERRGHLLAALAVLRPALASLETSTGSSDLVAATRRRVELLEQSLPRVTLCGAVPPDAVVLVDGTRRESRSLVIDPGDHEVAVDAPGRTRWRATFRTDAGDARDVGIQAGMPIGFGDVPVPTSHDAGERPEASPYHLGGSRGIQAPVARFRLVFPGLTPKTQVDAPTSTRTLVAPDMAPPAKSDERFDKALLGQVVAGTGFNVSSHAGMLMVTTSAGSVMPNARLGAAMSQSGTVFAVSGRW